MRSDPLYFSVENESAAKRPRFVIAIEYDVESIYLSSHAGISGVPGIHIENVLRRPSATSQRIVPDEGRSEIGSLSFSLVDLNRAFTEEVREKLGDGKGLRGKKVRFYVGYQHQFEVEGGGFGTWGETFGYGAGTTYDARFEEFQLFQTQIVVDASYEDGIYEVKCADITREQRQNIFEPKTTTLRDTISATATTVPVYSTAGFQPVYHGTSFSDAPSSTVGYIKIDKEWIRYTGFTADSFTGCTRGVLNTKAVEYTVDAGTDADRRPKVEEGIYLEMPAVKLAYAILTGRIYGTSPLQTLPPHWHLGIDPDLVRLSDFTGIDTDLWDTTDDSAGFVVRFQGLSSIDGKKFLENELYMLLGCYSPIYSDGTIGLKRMNQVLADAAYVVELNASNVIRHEALDHAMSSMHNRLQIDWNWNGEKFTRSTLFIDAQSVSTHGSAPLKKLQFKGLHGSRHTESIIRQRLDAFRDRYTSPPETTTVSVLSSLNRLEVGDIVRDRCPHVRDYAGNQNSIDRSFEIQRKSLDWSTGDVIIELFGSTAPASENAPNDTGTSAALPDAYYSSAGVDLSTVVTINVVGGVGVVQPGTYSLTGNADMNASGAIYYYLGDLEIADGAIIQVNNNVQLRVRGFVTINGDIDGIGRGKSGVASSGGVTTLNPGTSGYIGNSRGMDGVRRELLPPRGAQVYRTVPAAFTSGANSTFPYLGLTVSGSTLLGLPSDMRGTSGGGGGKLTYSNSSDPASGSVISQGGTGAASGAGLVIICRGLAMGASGSIDLSGNSSAATALTDLGGVDAYPGAGGAGGPGALFIGLDGSGVFIPDIGGRFIAATGAVPDNGNHLDPNSGIHPNQMQPIAGQLTADLISNVDLSNVAYRIQYIPQQETPEEDADDLPPTPTGLTVVAGERINTIRVTPAGPLGPTDQIEVFASITTNRSDAVRVAWGRGTEFTHDLPSGGTRSYWTRIRREIDGPDVFSGWLPESATAGVTGTALDFTGEIPSRTGLFLDTFEHQDYARYYNLISGTPTVTYPTNGENGGRVLRTAGKAQLDWKQNIPYDPTQIYIMTVRARMVTAPTDPTRDLFYAGAVGYAADGTTKIQTNGASSGNIEHYFAASAYDFGGVSLGTWVTFRGYLSGHSGAPSPAPAPSSANPMEMYTGVTFIRPTIVTNVENGDGVMEVDYVRIDRLIGTPWLEPNAATVVSTLTDDSHTDALAGADLLVAEIAVAAQSTDYLAIVTASYERWVTGSAAGAATYIAYEIPSTSINTFAGTYTNTLETTSPGRRVTLSGQVSVPAGAARNFQIRSIKIDGGAQHEFRNVNLQVEVIKA